MASKKFLWNYPLKTHSIGLRRYFPFQTNFQLKNGYAWSRKEKWFWRLKSGGVFLGNTIHNRFESWLPSIMEAAILKEVSHRIEALELYNPIGFDAIKIIAVASQPLRTASLWLNYAFPYQ